MPNTAKDLVAALENREDVRFGEISRALQDSPQDRERIVNELMGMISWTNLSKADRNCVLRFGGQRYVDDTNLAKGAVASAVER